MSEEEEGPPPQRWEVELEFVQGLANPMYVHFSAQQKYFEDEDFLRYLEYLEYWREMPHVQYIVYPNCSTMSTLSKQPEFRREIARIEVAQLIMDGFFRKWQLPPLDESKPKQEKQEETQEGNPEIKQEIRPESA